MDGRHSVQFVCLVLGATYFTERMLGPPLHTPKLHMHVDTLCAETFQQELRTDKSMYFFQRTPTHTAFLVALKLGVFQIVVVAHQVAVQTACLCDASGICSSDTLRENPVASSVCA